MPTQVLGPVAFYNFLTFSGKWHSSACDSQEPMEHWCQSDAHQVTNKAVCWVILYDRMNDTAFSLKILSSVGHDILSENIAFCSYESGILENPKVSIKQSEFLISSLDLTFKCTWHGLLSFCYHHHNVIIIVVVIIILIIIGFFAIFKFICLCSFPDSCSWSPVLHDIRPTEICRWGDTILCVA